jgi:hypothetical protein
LLRALGFFAFGDASFGAGLVTVTTPPAPTTGGGTPGISLKSVRPCCAASSFHALAASSSLAKPQR